MTLSSPFELPKPHNAQHIGNYVIHKKTLGTGSMGTVKLAESLSPQDHQLYAVKIMPKLNLNQTITSPTNDPKDTPQEREQRTVREMAIMHLLRHPNICQLKEWVVHGDQYYMFLEYVEGGPLLDYIISHGKLREKLARKLSRQIVSALDYCHKNSIVHRDLKIENILITPQQEIKMIDFGLSNIYSPSRQLDTFCGSLYFAAPELLQARHYTGPEVDVWSLGIVMYVLVCGRVPFDDTSLPALHQKIKLGHVDYPDHLSRDCVDLLSKILVVDPTKRATLSQVMYHPWMNKGYDEPVSNHLPHRTPLRQIDPFVVKGMQGFGLGQPEEIEARLNALIHSAEYQREELVPAQRWRLSIRRSPQPHVFQDPFISIYCLVKERQERDAKDRLLKSEGYQSPVQLGRSASTSLAKSNTTKQGLMRRKTERVQPSHTRHLFQQVDWASPVSHPPKPSHLLDRSESAAKRLEDELTLKQKTMNLFRSTSLSDRRKRPEITGGGRMIEEGLVEIPKMSTHPKSLFNFNHRHLFKLSTQDMLKYTHHVLLMLGIRYQHQAPFNLRCELLDGPRYQAHEETEEAIPTPVSFTLMIYQARWAGGRLGLKLLEAEEEGDKLYRRIYHTILNQLNHTMNKK